MTGFGQGYAQADGLRIEVEINSVNRKQLDVMVNLPRNLASLEPWVQEKLSHQMSRGRVHVQVAMQATGRLAAGSVEVNHALAERCVVELRRAAKKLDIGDAITLQDLIRVPGVLTVHDASEDLDRIKPVIEKALQRALRNFSTMRKREGAALGIDLAKRLEPLAQHVEKVAGRAPMLAGNYRKSLRDRIQQITGDLAVSDDRIEKEVVLFADRADITEELTRLQSHLQQARGMLRQKEPAGRALDFLAQEMFREINTIASKASDAVISGVVVQFKAELERLREQVQNIE
jgi:uncharacterized protein (TIGR00255 family)